MRTSICTLVLLLTAAAPALAEAPAGEAGDVGERLTAARGARDGFGAGIDPGFDALLYGEVAGGPLEVRTSRYAFDLDARISLAPRWILLPGFGVERSVYHLDGLSDAISGARDSDVDALEEVSVRLGVLHPYSGNLAFYGNLSASWSGEWGAGLDDGLRVGAVFGVRWALTERWAIRFGMGAFTRIEEDPLVLPALGVEGRLSEDWRLALGFPETRLSYRASEDIEVFLAGRFDFKDYRLDASGPLHRAVLRDDAVGVEVGARFDLSRDAEIEVALGRTVYRTLTIDDRRGKEIFEETLDGGFYLALSLTLQF